MKHLCLVSEIEIRYTPNFLSPEASRIKSSQDAHQIFLKLFGNQITVREECYAIFMNRENKVIGSYKVSSGGITSTVVDIRLILSIALKSLACGFMLAHSHPSGSLSPSKQDFALTLRIKEAARILDVLLLDHIILTNEGYYSFSDNGYL